MTYASPLCNQRTHAINTLLGLDEITAPTQPLVPADEQRVENQIFGNPGFPGSTGGGFITGFYTPALPGFPGFPTGPGLPGGPGPGVPGVPDVPPEGPVLPPPPPPGPLAIPEPASWATMLLGMAVIGSTIRRRRRPAASR